MARPWYEIDKKLKNGIVTLLCCILAFSFKAYADEPEAAGTETADDELEQVIVPERPSRTERPVMPADTLASDSIVGESLEIAMAEDSLSLAVDTVPQEFEKRIFFKPDPTRAVWLSALCPGLGQIYNRRYWKLPIVVGGYVGLIDAYVDASLSQFDISPNLSMQWSPAVFDASDRTRTIGVQCAFSF